MMMRRPTGVGLLGCGWIAELTHLPVLLASSTGRLVAAAETDPDRRDWLSRRAPGVALHESWEGLLSDPQVKAVIIALPTGLHADAACEAFAAGKHVYLEKPLATSLEDGHRVVAAWRQAGTLGAIGYNFRWNPIVQSALRTVAEGGLGPLLSIQGSFQWAAERIEGWRARPAEGGGVLLDLISHHVDLVAVITGQPIVLAQAWVRSVRSSDDTAAVCLRTAGGVTAQLTASFSAGAQVNRLEITGRRGVLRLNLLEGRPARVERVPGRGARVVRALEALEQLHPARLLRSPGREESFRITLESFLAAVHDGGPVTPDLGDGLRALAVIAAATASAASGGIPVPVSQAG